jgi:hypothetical protein
MAMWRPGSYDTHADWLDTNPGRRCCHGNCDPTATRWTWPDEAADLDRRGELVPIVFSVKLFGFLTPTLMGDDGRVWGGHHRIIAGYCTRLHVPYEVAPNLTFLDDAGEPAHG